MQDLLGKAGRAWYFISQFCPFEHFKIPKVSEMPKFMLQAKDKMESIGPDYDIRIFDIEGCFPHMPKSAIKLATLEVIHKLSAQGRKGVWIPRSKSPEWDAPKKHKQGTWIPLQELRDILVFALENAYIRLPNGSIRHQTQGIPMGDPLSPGMTITTCAWMEFE